MKATYANFDDMAFLNAVGCLQNHASPAWLKVRIARFIKAFQNEYKVYDEQKRELWKKYAEKDSEGNVVTVNNNVEFKDTENKKAFSEEYKELLKVDFDLPELRHSWIKDVDIPDGSFAAMIDILVLDVKEEEPEEAKNGDSGKN